MSYFGQKGINNGPGISKGGTHREPQSAWDNTNDNGLMS